MKGSVENNHNMIIGDRRVPYKDFEKEYPRWHCPKQKLIGPNGDFRKMFFWEYNIELAKYFGNKPSTKLPEVLPDKETIKYRLKKLVDDGN